MHAPLHAARKFRCVSMISWSLRQCQDVNMLVQAHMCTRTHVRISGSAADDYFLPRVLNIFTWWMMICCWWRKDGLIVLYKHYNQAPLHRILELLVSVCVCQRQIEYGTQRRRAWKEREGVAFFMCLFVRWFWMWQAPWISGTDTSTICASPSITGKFLISSVHKHCVYFDVF